VPPGDGFEGTLAPARVPADATDIDVEALYARFARAGHDYGPAFRALRWAATSAPDLWGRIVVDADDYASSQWHVHPSILDAAFQLALASVPVDEERETKYLPVHIERVRWLRPAAAEMLCRVSNVHHQDVRSYADVELFTLAGEPVAALHGSCCIRKSQAWRLAWNPVTSYVEEWQEAPAGTARKVDNDEAWCVCGAHEPALIEAMTAAGLRVTACTHSSVPPDAQRILVCASLAEPGEPAPEAVLHADWPFVELAQSLAERAHAAKLLVVTRGATWGQPGVESSIDMEQATLVALLRTLAT